MNPLSMPQLVLKRLGDDRMLLVSIFAGILIATTLAATLPVYFGALERLALNLDIDRLVRPRSNINAKAFNVVLTPQELHGTEAAVAEAIDHHISHIYDRRERYIVVDAHLAGLPRNPLPAPGTANRDASRAYFRSYSNLDQHVTLVDGNMASGEVESSPMGPVVEAVISPATAEMFELEVGSLIPTTPQLGADTMVFARVAGIVEAIDPREDYWTPRVSARVFLDPSEPDEEVEGLGRPVRPRRASCPAVRHSGGDARLGGPSLSRDSDRFRVVHTDRHGAAQGLVKLGGQAAPGGVRSRAPNRDARVEDVHRHHEDARSL